ncbi:OmpA family protein [Mesobaculum littorinae]|uniref:OmpA family protein n=1 Tax=Mesobaculum littorinae TaxID=2486419 RepID=A0A438AHZ6_9RHOB|nr:OmpA family protein [Mesobaculum littorinae]RVV98343.1 OmpA family protein [Mesobaculum littorinae]
MRLRSVVPTILVLLVAAAAALYAASVAVAQIEKQAVTDVRGALTAAGEEWVEVRADGLQLRLTGTAQTEATRFRALSIAGRVVDSARVIDDMAVAEAERIAAPDFSVEILRNDNGVSVIGLIPAATDRAALAASISDAADTDDVADLLESADFPSPKGWQSALDYGIEALENLPQSKVSISAGRVAVTAISQSPEDRERIESRLSRTRPEGLRLALDIAAPRPVITPFTLRFLIDDRGARFDACSAATTQGRDRILKAAADAGMEDGGDCTIGLGVPSPDWPEAMSAAIGTLGRLGGGTLTVSDADISLVAAQGTAPELFDAEVGALEGALPEVFALQATLPPPPEEATPAPQGPPQFIATQTEEGEVRLRGRVPDARTRAAIETFARARFGHGEVTDATRTVADLPEGWGPRILAALDAMALLEFGTVIVEPDSIAVSGTTGVQKARSEIARILASKLGEEADFTIDVAYDKTLDPTLGLPTPQECVDQANSVLAARQITFEPGSDMIDSAARDTVDRIADILRKCEDVTMEVGGHTDSQGRETMNRDLSQARAEAVLGALRARRVPTSNLTARGYGESEPIADNGTEEGREANRRIEFALLVSEEEAAAQAEAQAQAQADAEEGTPDDAATDTQSDATAADGAEDGDSAEDGDAEGENGDGAADDSAADRPDESGVVPEVRTPGEGDPTPRPRPQTDD